MEIFEEDDKFWIRHLKTGRLFRFHYSDRGTAQMVLEIIQDHWVRKITGEDEEVRREFVSDRALVKIWRYDDSKRCTTEDSSH